jgi:hypothetical protein
MRYKSNSTKYPTTLLSFLCSCVIASNSASLKVFKTEDENKIIGQIM